MKANEGIRITSFRRTYARIWCNRFRVNFATAPLAAPKANEGKTMKLRSFWSGGAPKTYSIDLSRYHAVTIWCNRFHVNFSHGPVAVAGDLVPSSPSYIFNGTVPLPLHPRRTWVIRRLALLFQHHLVVPAAPVSRSDVVHGLEHHLHALAHRARRRVALLERRVGQVFEGDAAAVVYHPHLHRPVRVCPTRTSPVPVPAWTMAFMPASDWPRWRGRRPGPPGAPPPGPPPAPHGAVPAAPPSASARPRRSTVGSGAGSSCRPHSRGTGGHR